MPKTLVLAIINTMIQSILKIRLSFTFVGLTLIFFVLLSLVPKTPLAAGALTLFTVNSFLLGFYVAPILTAQKARIDDINRVTHAEALVLYKIILQARALPKASYHHFKDQMSAYIKARINDKNPLSGEDQYEDMVGYCLDYEGKEKDAIDQIQTSLVDNQLNRSALNAAFRNHIYNHEWIVIFILYSVSMFFVLQIDFGKTLTLRLIAALLAAGITLILFILGKLSTLTHKKAKFIYESYQKLLATDYRRVD